MFYSRYLTVVSGHSPARGHTGHARGKYISSLCKTDGRDVVIQSGGGGQLHQGDVVVDGIWIPLGVGEHLRFTWLHHKCHNVTKLVNTAVNKLLNVCSHLLHFHGLYVLLILTACLVVFSQDHTVTSSAEKPHSIYSRLCQYLFEHNDFSVVR